MTGMTPEQKLLDMIKSAQGKLKLKKELKIFTKINIALVILIIVIFAVFLKDFLGFDYSVPALDVELPAGESVLPVSSDFEENIDDKAALAPEKDKVVDRENLVKDLNLLGIVEGDRDQAIVEDKKANRTFFLYKGDGFGEFKVYEIKNGKVILDYKGDKIELDM